MDHLLGDPGGFSVGAVVHAVLLSLVVGQQ
jgi:hypothetical protein